MSARADRLASKVLTELQKFGVSLTLTRTTVGAYDPATSTATSTTQTCPAQGLVSSTSELADAILRQLGSVPVGQQRKKVLLAASGLAVTPQVGDTLGPIDGQTWTVASMSTVGLQGQALFHAVEVRR